jgi:hypothetical protein
MTLAIPKLLNVADEETIAEYERAFYAAFKKVTENTLIRSLWCWNASTRRLSTRIGYSEQLIYIQPGLSSPIGAALAVNVAMKSVQSSAFGFRIPDDARVPCEIVTFFSVEDHRLANRLALLSHGFEDLRSRGYSDILTTTARRPLAAYRRFFSAFNGEIAAEAHMAGEARYFLRYRIQDLSCNSGNRTYFARTT